MNFSNTEKEIEYQMMVFSSLDLIEYKEIQKKNKFTNSGNVSNDEYLGLLMPFYESEFDLGSYGFIANNGFKFICIKKIDNSIQEASSEIRLKEVIIF